MCVGFQRVAQIVDLVDDFGDERIILLVQRIVGAGSDLAQRLHPALGGVAGVDVIIHRLQHGGDLRLDFRVIALVGQFFDNAVS